MGRKKWEDIKAAKLELRAERDRLLAADEKLVAQNQELLALVKTLGTAIRKARQALSASALT